MGIEQNFLRMIDHFHNLFEAQIFQLLIGQWIERVGRAGDQSFPETWHPFLRCFVQGHEFGNRSLSAGNDDLLAPASLLNQPRKFGFGLMDGDGFHKYMLANFA